MPIPNPEFARRELLSWYQRNKRDMPWRGSQNPYKVWISEIMLQQTRVEQATPYFLRFMERFPTVQDLAEAPQEDVLRIWEGLGYYSRARNMHAAAKQIVEQFDGEIPDTEKEILSLKGIGPYTSAAILSICFGKATAVVDGNVIRVLTRLTGIEEDVRSGLILKNVQQLANEFLDENQPGDFNQAVMELGATVCTPKNPQCTSCPLQLDCVAFSVAKTESIPYKSPAKKRPHKHIGVGVIKNGNRELLIAKRPENAMLGGLWEFPGGKQEEDETIPQTISRELHEELGVQVAVLDEITQIKHAYSHFTITLHAYFCELISGIPKPKSSQEIRWITPSQLPDFPFPKANRILTEKLQQIS